MYVPGVPSPDSGQVVVKDAEPLNSRPLNLLQRVVSTFGSLLGPYLRVPYYIAGPERDPNLENYPKRPIPLNYGRYHN